jgi:hypothetical protein
MLSDITFAVSPLVLDSKSASTFVTLRVKPDRRQCQLEVPAALERREGLKGVYATDNSRQ